MRKILAAAIREYKTTALTKAFLFGAVIFPLLIWGAIIGVTATGILSSEKEPLKGAIGVIDRTTGGAIAAGLEEQFDPERMAEAAARKAQEIEDAFRNSPAAQAMSGSMSEEQQRQGLEIAMRMLGIGQIPEVDVEVLDPEAEVEAVRSRVNRDDLLALIVVDERSMELPALMADADGESGDGGEPGAEGEGGNGASAPEPARGVYAFFHPRDLDPDYVEQIRRAAGRTIQNERYRRARIDPMFVRLAERYPPLSQTKSIGEGGEEAESNADFIRFLPFIFMMLLFTSVITGGQYLLMGTLEEKGSRVMEVLLSAISPLQLLIAKLLGQGAVGLTILVMYSALGVALADRFGYLALVPTDKLPWLVLYFLMAYAFLGSMMVSVGAAVTEIREAQALYAPITISMMLPFVLMIPILENPASMVARVFSYFPPTTPFVMVMRLSAPAHPVPMWELALSTIVGFAGVAVAVWFAAKVFRVGVLMYGKPPSLLTLIKWVRYA